MADRYWVGGTGTWNSTNTTNWSATSGGAGGASVPTSADNAIFDSNSHNTSYTCTIGGNPITELVTPCFNFTADNPSSGTLTFSAVFTELHVYGDATIGSGPSWSSFNSGRGEIHFRADSGGAGISVNISIDGTKLRRLRFIGVDNSSVFNLTSAIILATSVNQAVFLIQSFGTINFGAFTHNTRGALTATSNTVVNLDSCTINDCSNISVNSATFNAGTSTLNFVNNNIGLSIGSTSNIGSTNVTTFYNINSDVTGTTDGGTSQQFSIFHPIVVENFTFTRPNTAFSQLYFFADATFTNLTISGSNTGYKRVLVKPGGNSGSFVDLYRAQYLPNVTLTVTNSATLESVDFKDIEIAGAASPVSGTSLGDCGGNTGITFPAPKTVYWNLPTGAGWTANAWATSSGGAVSPANFPLVQDTAIIDDIGLDTNATIVFSKALGSVVFGTIDWSSRTNNFNFAQSSGIWSVNINGDLIGSSVDIRPGVGPPISIAMWGGLSQTISIAAVSPVFEIQELIIAKDAGTTVQLTQNLNIGSVGMSLDVQSGIFDVNGYTLNMSKLGTGNFGNLRMLGGTLDTNGGAVFCSNFTAPTGGYTTGGFVNLGSDTITLGLNDSSNQTVLDITPGVTLTFTYTTGGFAVVGSGQKTVAGGNNTLPPLTLNGSGIVIIEDDNTFENIKNAVSPAHLRITSGSTQTFNNFELSGTAGNLVTLDSTTTSQHTLVSQVDVGDINYLNISYSNASGPISTQWYAGANSVDSGNNTGWIFTNAPPPPRGEFFMVLLG